MGCGKPLALQNGLERIVNVRKKQRNQQHPTSFLLGRQKVAQRLTLAKVWSIALASLFASHATFALANEPNNPSPHTPADDADADSATTVKVQTLSRQEIAERLGWISSNVNHCSGYYREPRLLYDDESVLPIQTSRVEMVANSSELAQTGSSILAGDVIIRQPGRQIQADLAYLNRDRESGRFTQTDLYGNVIFREPGRVIISDEAHINLTDRSGELTRTFYRILATDILKDEDLGQDWLIPDEEGSVIISHLSGWGEAERMTRDANGVFDIYNGSYTTCPPLSNVWSLKANQLDLNQESGIGTAKHARIYIKDIPVLYTPYITFPIDDERKSGFLFPSAGSSSDYGYYLSTPYYLNLAPNYDATITPVFMSLRGIQMNGEFRYLDYNHSGNIHGSFLPSDQEFASFKNRLLAETADSNLVDGRKRLEDSSDNRGFISLTDLRRYSANWSSYVYLNYASDDYYFEDFSSDPSQTTDNQILNKAELRYRSPNWDFTGRLQAYQTLHPLDQAPVGNQYRKLPELILNGQYPNLVSNFYFESNNSFTYFDKQQNPDSLAIPINGGRLNINPAVSYPIYWVSGYFTPEVQLAATQYDLQNANANLRPQQPKNPANITRILPLYDIDMGLFFERTTHLFGESYLQTLEPRLFYLYVPYRDQSDIPLFDTSVQPFSIEQLFRTNRFNGIDRIGDTNQISWALTSRFLTEASGEEKMRATIGQIVYFQNRRVQLQALDLVTDLNSVPPDTPTSPLVGQLVYKLNPDWAVISSMAWDPNTNITNNGNLIFQYKPADNKIFNVGLTYLRGGDRYPFADLLSAKNDLYQTDVSTVWPLWGNWSAVARWNYNISHGFTQDAFAGIQYDACCWAVRLVGGRSFKYQEVDSVTRTSKPVLNDKIYLEFALKGLGNVGFSNPGSLLAEGILGYEDTFGM